MIVLAQVGHECPYIASPYSREVAALLRYHCAPRNDARLGKPQSFAVVTRVAPPSHYGEGRGGASLAVVTRALPPSHHGRAGEGPLQVAGVLIGGEMGLQLL